MGNKLTVNSVEEWNQLPEVLFPYTKYANQKGAIHKVTKTGGLWGSKDDLKDIDISEAFSVDGKYLLPTIVISKDGQENLMRLPLYAGQWTAHLLSFASQGNNLLPLKVEFSTFNGKPSIELI